MKRIVNVGIILYFYLCPYPLLAETVKIPEPNIKWAKKQGKEFCSAYKLFLKAPMERYNYALAEVAFKKLLKSPNLQQRINAVYFLSLCEFSSLKFKNANKYIQLLVKLLKQTQPKNIVTRIAEEIIENSGKYNFENIDQLKNIIIKYSYLKVIMPGAQKEKLMDASTTSEVLSYIDLLAKMRESFIYKNATTKITELEKSQITDEQKTILTQLKKHIAELQKSSEENFLMTIVILSLESSRLSKKLPDLKNSIGEAICAHNMKQIGMAFHLYLLDHGKFPVLQEIKKVKMKGKDADLRELWVDKLKPYFGIKQGNLINYYGIYRSIPEKSPFQCPVAVAPSKITSVVQYGYNCMWPFGWTPKTEANLGSGLIKYSMLKPEKHLLLADAWYFGATDGRGSARLYTFDILNPRHKGYVNVLYADGHVNAENFNFLWEANTNGEPWNSNRPYKKRAKINLWKHKILEIK